MSFKKRFRKRLRKSPIGRFLRARQIRSELAARHQRYPELIWSLGPFAPLERVEVGRLQIGPRVYTFGGYVTLSRVTRRVECFDLETKRWHSLGNLPEGAAETHRGLCSDGGETIFYIGGQKGPQCHPATNRCFAFNTEIGSWQELPPLPEARYAPLVAYHKGRIHCLSGVRPDRCSSANEHWSLAIDQGQAAEKTWRTDKPLPSPRTHTASLLVGDELFVFGGQETDVPPIEGDPLYRCDFNTPFDRVTDACFAFHLETGAMRDLAPMPEPISHSEDAICRVGKHCIIAGGVYDRARMCDKIFVYDLEQDRWSPAGRLPYPMKCKVAAYWNQELAIALGQRSVSETDLRPREVLDTVFYTRLELAES